MPDQDIQLFDRAFDGLLARSIRSYAEGGVRPIDATEIAVASMSRPTGRGSAWLPRFRAPTRVAVLAVVVIALLIAGGLILVAGAALIERASPDRLDAAETTLPRRLAYETNGVPYLADEDGAKPVRVTDGTALGPWFGPDWSPDGRYVTFTGQEQIYLVVDEHGGFIASGEGCCPGWAPDSTRIATMIFGPDTPTEGGPPRPDRIGPTASVLISAVDGTVLSRIDLPAGTTPGNIVRIFWSPDGESVVVSRLGGGPDGRTWLIPINGGPPRAFPVEPSYGTRTFFSPDGQWVVGVAGERLVVAAADGSDIRVPPMSADSASHQFSAPLWAPDSDRIAVSYEDPEGTTVLAVIDLSTGRVQRLWATTPGGTTVYQIYAKGWSADGERILFEAAEEGRPALWSIRAADGSDLRRLVDGQVTGAWQPAP